jgi:hypothetical protein
MKVWKYGSTVLVILVFRGFEDAAAVQDYVVVVAYAAVVVAAYVDVVAAAYAVAVANAAAGQDYAVAVAAYVAATRDSVAVAIHVVTGWYVVVDYYAVRQFDFGLLPSAVVDLAGDELPDLGWTRVCPYEIVIHDLLLHGS